MRRHVNRPKTVPREAINMRKYTTQKNDALFFIWHEINKLRSSEVTGDMKSVARKVSVMVTLTQAADFAYRTVDFKSHASSLPHAQPNICYTITSLAARYSCSTATHRQMLGSCRHRNPPSHRCQSPNALLARTSMSAIHHSAKNAVTSAVEICTYKPPKSRNMASCRRIILQCAVVYSARYSSCENRCGMGDQLTSLSQDTQTNCPEAFSDRFQLI
jgi:hypothetical protein